MIACPTCRTIQSPDAINSGALFRCANCNAKMRADLFPAFFRPMEPGLAGQSVMEQGQAECYNHPGRQAKVACGQCGRLLCELCEVELQGRSLCFSCLKSSREKQTEVSLENQRTLYDSIALALALLPIPFVFPTLLTAPSAIYVALRYWKRPSSILPRSHWRNILAVVLAGAQVLGWIIFLITIIG